jgi:TctA family transporter
MDMTLVSNLALGFGVALTLNNLLYCWIGCMLGTLIGVLPGIGPVATIAMLLPATFALPPESALIMLAGIYYGAQYGGSTTAILINIPGESSSVVTALDGYQMARQGRAGPALSTAAFGSFFAGTIATFLLAAAAPPLAQIAFKFGPAEYFSLMTLGLIAAVVLAHGSVIKAIGMIILGLLLGLVGTDVNSGAARFNFSIPELSDGIGFVVVAMGVFGLAEIMKNLEQGDEEREVFTAAISSKGGRPFSSRAGYIFGALIGYSVLGLFIGSHITASQGSAPALISFNDLPRMQSMFGMLADSWTARVVMVVTLISVGLVIYASLVRSRAVNDVKIFLISLVPLAVLAFMPLGNLLGVGALLLALAAALYFGVRESKHMQEPTDYFTELLPNMADVKAAAPAVLRGTGLGSLLGILPGGGAVLASFAAYTLEKKIAKDPSTFGKGDIRGVAAPESANNAAAQTSFIPLLTLGIPPNPVMALMVGAMIIQGIQPGPQVMTDKPALFWGMIASMWVGNLLLVVLNLPLVGMWIKLLTVPYRLLYPAILVFCAIGVYSLSNSPFDVVITAAFGLIGYIFVKLDCEPAPLLLGFILGPMMEENLRRAMLISRGDGTVFFTRPLSASLLAVAALLLVVILLPAIRKKREEAFQEE